MPKRDDQRRINALPGGVAHAASTIITETETHGGEPGVIGGWVFGPTALTSGKAIISSEGWLQVGVDDHLVRLDALDTGYRLWAGDALGADAPFSVDVAGSLHAENAYLQGEVVAESGAIGGWAISAAELSAGTGAARVGLLPGTWPFYAGGEDPAAAPYRVSAAGLLTAQGATIEGAITATSGQLMDLSVAGTLNLVTGGVIKSDGYVAGVSGWQIGNDGKAEFQDALVRGVLTTVVFQESTVSTVLGSLKIEPEQKTYTTTVEFTIPVAPGTFIVQTQTGSPPALWGEMIEVTYGATTVTCYIDLDSGDGVYYCNNSGGGGGLTFPVGSIVHVSGASAQVGYLMLTAEPVMKGPRLLVVQGTTTEAVIGNLDGSYGQVTEVYGVGLGNYSGGNFLRYTTAGGLVIEAGSGTIILDDTGLTVDAIAAGGSAIAITGNLEMADDSWIGYPSGPLITFDNTDEQVEVTGSLAVSANVIVSGDYKIYRNATAYTGYIFVPLTTPATSTDWDGDLYDVDNDEVTIDLSAAFGIPAEVKAVSLILYASCPTVGQYAALQTVTGINAAVEVRTQVANVLTANSGIVPCDANGDIFFRTNAVHGAEVTVYIRIFGYWI